MPLKELLGCTLVVEMPEMSHYDVTHALIVLYKKHLSYTSTFSGCLSCIRVTKKCYQTSFLIEELFLFVFQISAFFLLASLLMQISGFSYICSLGGTVNLPAVYNNESSLTCRVNQNQVM